MKKTIKLYGVLAKKFGKKYELDVKTPAEAVRALCCMVKGFKEHLKEFSEPGYRVIVGKQEIGEEELQYPTSQKEEIKIIPYIAGSGGFFKVILGATLIAAYFITGGTNPFLLKAGIGIALAGVAEILFSPPKPPGPAEKPENKPSYAFDGPVNTVAQGNPVPLAYGKIRCGSQIISAGLYAQEINA